MRVVQILVLIFGNLAFGLIGDRTYHLNGEIKVRVVGSLKRLGEPLKGYEDRKPSYDTVMRRGDYFVARNLAPCDPTTEYTLLTSYSRDHYFCTDKNFFEQNIDDASRILHLQDLDYVTEEDRPAAKAYYVARVNRYQYSWASQPGAIPPVGRYFVPSYPVDMKGPFESVFNEGKRTGFAKLSERGFEEAIVGKKYFIVDALDPCNEVTQYTIREKLRKGYFCIDKDAFEKFFREGYEKEWASYVYGDDLQFAPRASQKAASEIMKKLLPPMPVDYTGKGELILTFNPFMYVLEEMDKPFKVQIYSYNYKNIKNGYLVTYKGTLFGLCGDQCKLQGYAVVMDSTGKIIKYLYSNLAQTAAEYDIKEDGLERMRLLANDENKQLTELFRTSGFNKDYIAKMSKSTSLWEAGNSVGTFMLQVTMAREALRDRPGFSKDWPKFDWKLK